jgi:two-component system, LuxR family, response regulator FixJ
VKSLRVYFVDDDKFFLDVMTRMLRSSGFDVVSYLSANELLNDLNPEFKGCILADLDMPSMDGMALQQELLRSGNPLPIVFLTGSGNIPVSVQAMRLGAEDFIIKGAPKEGLIAAINRAFDRFKKEQSLRAQQSAVLEKLALLTDREREVLKHVVQGKLNKQIADDLGIHERTVKLHRTAITSKLGMPSVAELTKFWLKADFPPEN